MTFQPPSRNLYNLTPLSSSELTKIRKNRTIYSDYITKVQNNNVGCDTARTGLQDGVAAGSIIPDLLIGARFTSAEERDRILGTNACQFPIPPIPIPAVVGGSILFNIAFGSEGSQVTYPNDANLALGDGDFTIEWFQYWTDDSTNARPFSIGSYGESDTSIAVSYEGSIYFWNGMSAEVVSNSNPPLNTWTHIAIVGTGGSNVAFYINGTNVYDETLNYDFTDSTTALSIGNETIPDGILGAFGGNITNFRWVKGTAVYSGASLTVPTQPLTAISGTQLLLLASNQTDAFKDSSPANRTPTITGAAYSSTSPF